MSEFDRAAARSFAGGGHDHRACMAGALAQAQTICARRGARLTELRRRVLELIWEGHAPVGAYDLLRRLSEERDGMAMPPTVYRALDFLLEHGLVHRIESMNAFVGCAVPTLDHAGQFLICRACGTAAEMHDPAVNRAIEHGAEALGFAVEHSTIEVAGVCRSCRTHGTEAGDAPAG